MRPVDIITAFNVPSHVADGDIEAYADRHLTELVYDLQARAIQRLDWLEQTC